MDSNHLTMLLVWAVAIALFWMLIASATSFGTRHNGRKRDSDRYE